MAAGSSGHKFWWEGFVLLCMFLNDGVGMDGGVADLLSELRSRYTQVFLNELRKADTELAAIYILYAHVLDIKVEEYKQRSTYLKANTVAQEFAAQLPIFLDKFSKEEIDEMGRLTDYDEIFEKYQLPSGSVDGLLGELRMARNEREAQDIFVARVIGISLEEYNVRLIGENALNEYYELSEKLKAQSPIFLCKLSNEEIEEIGKFTGYNFERFKKPSGSVADLLRKLRNADTTREAANIFLYHVIGVSTHCNHLFPDKAAYDNTLNFEARFFMGQVDEDIYNEIVELTGLEKKFKGIRLMTNPFWKPFKCILDQVTGLFISHFNCNEEAFRACYKSDIIDFYAQATTALNIALIPSPKCLKSACFRNRGTDISSGWYTDYTHYVL